MCLLPDGSVLAFELVMQRHLLAEACFELWTFAGELKPLATDHPYSE